MLCSPNETCLYPSTGSSPALFSTAIQFFAATQCLIKSESPPDSLIEDKQEFDYIVIGAGTAGCIVANRLTEDKCRTVLLLEAGDSAPVETRIPSQDKSMFGSVYDWGYLTTNDSRISQANKNGSIIWPRGKMMGGSSNLNAMIYIKGQHQDYQSWYDEGNEEWHPDIVQKYFKKAESYQYQDLLGNSDIYAEYGHYGPLVINRYNSTYRPLLDKVLDSWTEIGVKRVKDLNYVPGVFKAGIHATTAANGIRYSSDYAYINPIQNRPNLKIRKNSLVTRILLDDSTRAYGVEVEHNGIKQIFYAKFEVIVSAGTINTPQLLMLSGIGPKDHLHSKNITCKVDSPLVGQNLQDHCIVPITIYGKGPEGPDNATQNFAAIQYIYNRTGSLAQNSLSNILAFYSSSCNKSYSEFQSHMTILWRNMSTVRSIFDGRFRYREPVPSSIAEINRKYMLFLFQFNLLHPKSRGNISLHTNNPKDHPLIYPNYFLKSEDLDLAINGIKILTRIIRTAFFRSIDAFVGRIKWPACDKFKVDSVPYWKCICINMVLSVYHPVGTSKMGPNPSTSVVDSRLKVHGIKSLRIIDASIMPTITSGNTNGPTTMIGERGADLVKEDYISYCSSLNKVQDNN